MALANAGAFDYPFVGSLDQGFQFGIGNDALRQETAGACDACVGQKLIPLTSFRTWGPVACISTKIKADRIAKGSGKLIELPGDHRRLRSCG
jgi:hypothetical protein